MFNTCLSAFPISKACTSRFTFWHVSTPTGFWHKHCELPSNGVADHGTNKTALQRLGAAPISLWLQRPLRWHFGPKNPLFWFANQVYFAPVSKLFGELCFLQLFLLECQRINVSTIKGMILASTTLQGDFFSPRLYLFPLYSGSLKYAEFRAVRTLV